MRHSAPMRIPPGYAEHLITPQAARKTEAQWSFSPATPGTAIILPDGRCDIILRTARDDQNTVTPVITGPATLPYTISYTANDAWIGLRLHPTQAAALWGQHIDNAKNNVLRGPQALSHLPQLHTLKTAAQLHALVAILPTNPVHPLLPRTLTLCHLSGGRMPVSTLAQHVGCAPRHLTRIFRAATGLTPKTYCAIIQFHRALALLKTHQLRPADAAFEAGYADQPHMTRNFRRLSGFSPARIPDNLSLPGLPNV